MSVRTKCTAVQHFYLWSFTSLTAKWIHVLPLSFNDKFVSRDYLQFQEDEEEVSNADRVAYETRKSEEANAARERIHAEIRQMEEESAREEHERRMRIQWEEVRTCQSLPYVIRFWFHYWLTHLAFCRLTNKTRRNQTGFNSLCAGSSSW